MQQEKLTRRAFLRSSAAAAAALGLAACAPAQVAPSGEGGEAPCGRGRDLDLRLRHHQRRSCQSPRQMGDRILGGQPRHRRRTPACPRRPRLHHQNPDPLRRAARRPTCTAISGEHPIITVDAKQMHMQLDDYIARDSYDLTDFRPDAVELYRWNGKTYALPRLRQPKPLLQRRSAGSRGPRAAAARLERHRLHLRSLPRHGAAPDQKEGDRTTQWGFLVNRG